MSAVDSQTENLVLGLVDHERFYRLFPGMFLLKLQKQQQLQQEQQQEQNFTEPRFTTSPVTKPCSHRQIHV